MARRGIILKQSGGFTSVEKWLRGKTWLNSTDTRVLRILRTCGEEGVRELREATPKRSGKTALKWEYEVLKERGSYSLRFFNADEKNGVSIVILLVHGHATRSGGWVAGNDFISPVAERIFDSLQKEIDKEVARR